MTRVCLLGAEGVALRYELLSHETAREALATYELREPYENAVGLETISLGAAVSLLNDLNWYLVRYVDRALVLEPSISDDEWLSRALATAVRDDELEPGETDRFLMVYGVVEPDREADPPAASGQPAESPRGGPGDGPGRDADSPGDGERVDEADAGENDDRKPRLVEPMYVARTGPELPAYDLREVHDTLVVRVTEEEFGG